MMIGCIDNRLAICMNNFNACNGHSVILYGQSVCAERRYRSVLHSAAISEMSRLPVRRVLRRHRSGLKCECARMSFRPLSKYRSAVIVLSYFAIPWRLYLKHGKHGKPYIVTARINISNMTTCFSAYSLPPGEGIQPFGLTISGTSSSTVCAPKFPMTTTTSACKTKESSDQVDLMQ
jgi:hypothetical protein